MAKFFETNFINQFDQDIQVGDEVVAVTTGYSHSLSIHEAIYRGRYADGSPAVEPVIKEKPTWYKGPRKLPRGRIFKISDSSKEDVNRLASLV